MSNDVKKKRIRSVILMSALGAVACGGQATGQDTGDGNGRDTGGDGDGDRYVGDPVGDYFVGAMITGGTGGTIYIGAPGDPPYYGGAGGEEPVGDEIVGLPR